MTLLIAKFSLLIFNFYYQEIDKIMLNDNPNFSDF